MRPLRIKIKHNTFIPIPMILVDEASKLFKDIPIYWDQCSTDLGNGKYVELKVMMAALEERQQRATDERSREMIWLRILILDRVLERYELTGQIEKWRVLNKRSKRMVNLPGGWTDKELASFERQARALLENEPETYRAKAGARYSERLKGDLADQFDISSISRVYRLLTELEV